MDLALISPLVREKLIIVVSQDVAKASPGQNTVNAVLEQECASVNRAVWDGRCTAYDEVDAEGSPFNYVAFRQATVTPGGKSIAGASGHHNTWRVAYTIEPTANESSASTKRVIGGTCFIRSQKS
jgi:predicted peptidase